jgi:hypothetical protein
MGMARNAHLDLRLSAAELLTILAAAESSGMAPSSWVRHHALRVAGGKP